LGAGSSVGENTVLVARVSIYPGVSVGKRCIVHAGAVLGSDGFGLARDGARWVKLPQLGSLRVGDDVEVGANTTIDRGAMDDTVVEDGVKLDNQIHIGHNVSIGAHTAMAACVGIAGSTRIGRGCAIGGGSCIAGHIELCEGVQIAAMSGVSRSLREPGIYASGIAVEPVEKWRRNSARFRHLDKLARRVKALESRLASLGEDEDG
jgi:UDP-3-O-[3-hydroxymyristoyl] glucosamine N-acyltransferase